MAQAALNINDLDIDVLPGGAGEAVLFVPGVVIAVIIITYPTPAY